MTVPHWSRKSFEEYGRLGRLITSGVSPDMRMSRAIQICKTWRSHFAWRLVRALGRAR